MLIVVSLVSILAAGVLWLELVIRAALLYVGALLGTVVYAGLVDKNMWGHVRRWAGIMIAVILVKPVIVIVLGLAGALSADGRTRRLLRRRLRPRDHPARHLRQRDDLPLRPRLRRRDRRLPQQPHDAGRREPGRRRHQLARRPWSPRASRPTAPARGGNGRRAQRRPAPAPPTPSPAASPRTAPARPAAAAAAAAAPRPARTQPAEHRPHASSTRNSSNNRTGGEGR